MADENDFDPEETSTLDTAGQAAQGNPAAMKWLLGALAVFAAIGGLVLSTVFVVSRNAGEFIMDALQGLTDDEENSDDNDDDGFWSTE